MLCLQWLFVVEGLPTIVLGVWMNRSLAETPLTADFLKPDEAEWLHQRQQKAKVSATAEASLCFAHVNQGSFVLVQ